MVAEIKAKEGNSFGSYVVVQVELLALKEVVEKLNGPRHQDDPAELEAFKATVAGIYESVYGMRNIFMDAYDRFLDGNIGTLGLTDMQEESLSRLLKCEVGFKYLTDSVLVYAPMCTERNRIPARTIFTIMCAAVEMFSECLMAGNRFQVWMDIGLGMEGNENNFYGPEMVGLGRGMILQPRVAIGKGLHEYLKRADIVVDATDFEPVMNRQFADRCLEVLESDVDGVPIVGYMGEKFRVFNQ